MPPKPCSPKPSGIRSKVSTPPRRSLAPHALGAGKYRYYFMVVSSVCYWYLNCLWICWFGNYWYCSGSFSQSTCCLNVVCFFIAAVPHETELSMIGKSVLQSTFSDGHYFGPDFDISAIKGKFHIKPVKSLKLQFDLWTFLICVSKIKQFMNM